MGRRGAVFRSLMPLSVEISPCSPSQHLVRCTHTKKKKPQMSVQIFVVVVEITVLAELCYLLPGGIVLGSILMVLDATRSRLVCSLFC